jgi:hypothetical protein
MPRSARSSYNDAPYQANSSAAYAVTNGPRHSSPGTPRKKKHHPILWTILILLVVLIAVGGFFGFKFYKEAKQVQLHEQNALTILSSFQDVKSADSLKTVSNQVPELQEETAAAKKISHGQMWNALTHAPWLGSDVSTLQGMTEVVDDLSQDAIPSYLKTVESLTGSKLSTGDGQLNLQPIMAAQKTLPSANKLIDAAYTKYRKLATPKIGILKNAYVKGEKKLKEVRDTSKDLLGTINFLPGFLGNNGSKTYVIASVTPAETRSSGGLVGSLGSMTTNNGKVTMGKFYPNKNFQNLGYPNKTSEAQLLFNEPLHFSFDVRDQNFTPVFATAAAGIQQAWSWAGYSGATNGVMQIDPVFLQEVNKVSGSITLSNGTKLDGNNTAEYLQSTIYKTVPVYLQDAVFGEVAARSVQNLFSNMGYAKLASLSKVLPKLGQARHFQMTSDDPSTQKYMSANGYTPQPQASEKAPTVGIYVNQQNASKLDWYTKRTTTVTRSSCNTDGSQTYHVHFTMKNNLTQNELNTLSLYITGDRPKKMAPGLSTEKVLFYAPAGGSISGFKVTGNGRTPAAYTLNGQKLFMSVASIGVGASTSYDFDVTTSTKASEDLEVDQTPTTTIDTGISYDTEACEVKK